MAYTYDELYRLSNEGNVHSSEYDYSFKNFDRLRKMGFKHLIFSRAVSLALTSEISLDDLESYYFDIKNSDDTNVYRIFLLIYSLNDTIRDDTYPPYPTHIGIEGIFKEPLEDDELNLGRIDIFHDCELSTLSFSFRFEKE